MTSWQLRVRWAAAGSVVAVLLVGVGEASRGEVVLDGKFGTSGALAGPDFSITDSLGAVRGNNLFHSFTRFDLAAGETATFSGPANIRNILSRVTGDGPSSIDGTIRSTIAGANFFLINPSGIVFGPSAAIDVSGSFAASTANYLKLADGARFVAALDADDSGLSTAEVSAFGFLGNPSGSIEVQQSALSVPSGKTISLVGGDILVDGGTLQSAGGQINIVSINSPGEAPADPISLSGADFPQQGEITFQNDAGIDASGDGGGRIAIRGGQLTVDNSKIQANTAGASDGQGIDVAVLGDLNISNGGQINSLSPDGLGAGGNISITAQSIRLDGGGLTDDFFQPTTQISAATGDPLLGGGPAKGGDIVIKAGSLELVNSAQISSATFGGGDAGRIEINAAAVRLDALLFTPTQITANTQQIEGAGNAGDIIITADALEVRNGATLLAASFGSGAAGLIDINARSVNLLGGAIITAGTFGAGNGGNVEITTETMRIDGRDTLFGGDDLLTGIQAVTTSPDFPAPGGDIQITAGTLDLRNMGSIFTTSYGIGVAGNISLQAAGAITLTRNSSVSTSAPGSSGGNISVTAGTEIRLADSQITAQAGLDGGNISLAAPKLIYLFHSTLSGQADATDSGFGNGGNINIDPSFLILNDSSLISKSSFGNGGNITILSDFFFPSASIIDASAPFGLPGTVSVTAPEVDLSGALVALAGNFLDAGAQLRPDCGVRLTGNISSFIVLGRGGLPLAPGGFVPSTIPAGGNDAQ